MQISHTKPKTSSSAIINLSNFKIGLFISLAIQPFEVIRTSSIMSLKASAKDINLIGTMETIKKIFQLEGVRGFFRGSLLSVGKSTLGAGLFFTGLDNISVVTQELRKIPFIHSGFVDFLDASLLKTMITFLLNPIIVLKTRFEVVGINEHKNIRSAVCSIYKNEGMKGFYKGIFATLIRDVPYSGLQYSSYRWLLELYGSLTNSNVNPQSKPAIVVFASLISAIWAVMATYPFDNLRVRMQCRVSSDSNMITLVKDVYINEGIKGFYIGYMPRLMKKAASSALMWSLYEKIKNDSKSQLI